MKFRRLTTQERRSVGMPSNLYRYTTAPAGSTIDKTMVFPRRAMVALATATEIENRKAPMPPKASAPTRRYNDWPKGYGITTGKRVYPPGHEYEGAIGFKWTPSGMPIPIRPEKKPEPQPLPMSAPVAPPVQFIDRRQPQYTEIQLSDVPQSQPLNTPSIEPKSAPMTDFEVTSAAIALLTKRLEDLERTQSTGGGAHRLLLRRIRERCVEFTTAGHPEARSLARYFLDIIDETAPDIGRVKAR